MVFAVLSIASHLVLVSASSAGVLDLVGLGPKSAVDRYCRSIMESPEPSRNALLTGNPDLDCGKSMSHKPLQAVFARLYSAARLSEHTCEASAKRLDRFKERLRLHGPACKGAKAGPVAVTGQAQAHGEVAAVVRSQAVEPRQNCIAELRKLQGEISAEEKVIRNMLATADAEYKAAMTKACPSGCPPSYLCLANWRGPLQGRIRKVYGAYESIAKEMHDVAEKAAKAIGMHELEIQKAGGYLKQESATEGRMGEEAPAAP